MKANAKYLAAAAAATVLATAACSGGSGGQGAAATAKPLDTASLVTTTTAGKADAGTIKWNLPYEPLSLDPIKSFNYAENTALANMCESILRATPDFKAEPGLAESFDNPTPTTWVYKIRSGVKFWNGKPLTAEDVAYSIGRNLDPDAGSYLGKYFVNVSSVKVTGDLEVTITLKQPDALLNQSLAALGGIVTEKASTQKAGSTFGTPSSPPMCTGPFEFTGWTSGQSITMTRNDGYWDTALKAKSKGLELRFIADESTAVLALESGELDGEFFYLPPAGLEKLRSSSNTTVSLGQSLIYWTMLGAATDGPYADPRIRRALLLATDRTALASTVFQGTAIAERGLGSPSYWTYSRDTFAAAYEKLPGVAADYAAAKKLVDEVKPDRPITIAVQGSSAVHEQTASLLQATGQAIGLTVNIKRIPVEQYGNIYVDPKAREGIDAFLSTYYGIPDLLDAYSMFQKGDQANYTNYDAVDALVGQARAESDDAKRAALVTQIQQKVVEDAVWLPLNQLPTIVVQGKRISGATASSNYLYYPWASQIGTR